MLSNVQIVALGTIGVIVYAFCTNEPKRRDTPKYVLAKTGAGVASICLGILAIQLSGTTHFFPLAGALLAGQIAFKVMEDRCDRLARVYC